MKTVPVIFAVYAALMTVGKSPALKSEEACRNLQAQAGNECCDPDGADTQCPAVTGNCSTAPVPQIPGVTRYGVWCDPEGQFCQHAPQGPYDAECESSWFSVTCGYNAAKSECNFLYQATCASEMLTKEDEPNVEYYTCVCKGGVPTSNASKTRTECHGDSCWW